MNNIEEETITKILKLKEALSIMNVDEKNIVFMPEPIHPLAYGMEKAVIFIEIAGIKVVNIIGIEEEPEEIPRCKKCGGTGSDIIRMDSPLDCHLTQHLSLVNVNYENIQNNRSKCISRYKYKFIKDAYRCTGCGVFFHLDCIYKHFEEEEGHDVARNALIAIRAHIIHTEIPKFKPKKNKIDPIELLKIVENGLSRQENNRRLKL